MWDTVQSPAEIGPAAAQALDLYVNYSLGNPRSDPALALGEWFWRERYESSGGTWPPPLPKDDLQAEGRKLTAGLSSATARIQTIELKRAVSKAAAAAERWAEESRLASRDVTPDRRAAAAHAKARDEAATAAMAAWADALPLLQRRDEQAAAMAAAAAADESATTPALERPAPTFR